MDVTFLEFEEAPAVYLSSDKGEQPQKPQEKRAILSLKFPVPEGSRRR